MKITYYNQILKILKPLPWKITYRVYRFNEPLNLKKNPSGPRAGFSKKARPMGI